MGKGATVVSWDVKLSLSFEKAGSPVCLSKEKLNQIDAQVRGRKKLEYKWKQEAFLCKTEGSNSTVQHIYLSPLSLQLSKFKKNMNNGSYLNTSISDTFKKYVICRGFILEGL